MGNCKDCRHWETHKDQRNVIWNECSHIDWKNKGENIKHDSAAIYAYASDDSGLNTGLMTGPLFGCINFKEKIRRWRN